MEEIKWLWDYLRDVYQVPMTYICKKQHFLWMSYTAEFVEILREYVSVKRRLFGVEGAILDFQRRTSQMKNMEMAIAAHAVAQAALETWRASVYK